jgi:uncharacterized protein YcnI
MANRWLPIAALAVSASPALAHITLEQREARIGVPYKAVFRVPHGCDGSATIRLSVQIPEGVIAVKPMAKAGWTIEVTRGAYAKPYSATHGAKFTEGPKQITWSGGILPDAFYDEFVFQAFIAADLPSSGTLYFPAMQECEKGVHRWIEVPTAPNEKLSEPAPGLKLLPKANDQGE